MNVPSPILSLPEITLAGGRFRVTPARGSCFLGETEIRLTAAELRAIHVLASNAGCIVPYDALALELGLTKNARPNIATLIKRLRNRLFPDDEVRRRTSIVARYGHGLQLNLSALAQ